MSFQAIRQSFTHAAQWLSEAATNIRSLFNWSGVRAAPSPKPVVSFVNPMYLPGGSKDINTTPWRDVESLYSANPMKDDSHNYEYQAMVDVVLPKITPSRNSLTVSWVQSFQVEPPVSALHTDADDLVDAGNDHFGDLDEILFEITPRDVHLGHSVTSISPQTESTLVSPISSSPIFFDEQPETLNTKSDSSVTTLTRQYQESQPVEERASTTVITEIPKNHVTTLKRQLTTAPSAMKLNKSLSDGLPLAQQGRVAQLRDQFLNASMRQRTE